ncbi:hypothetical protein [Nocardioides islandensis]|uniref:hypothetical protein n=1 Tax=Nocardioides islandensis TaxID=433663 RepID=UPI002264CCF8|nr:hypothetical protein [Nocardioides islandensis]
MHLTRLRRAAAPPLLWGAAPPVGPLSSGPAAASACPGTSGVTVVVEFKQLGRGSAQSCVADGGGHTADRLLRDAGYALDFVQRFPGFVCRIDGLPADDPCVNTPPSDAYWGLWWSDGTTGKWTYSSLGAGSLSVPAGGYVAMVWDGSAASVAPAASPTVHPTPTPTPTPTKKPTPTPTASPTSASVTPTGTAAPTGTPSTKPTRKPTTKPSATRTSEPSGTATPTPTPTPSPSATPSDPPAADGTGGTSDDGGGLPGWVPPVLVAVMLAAAGAVAVVRRRS